MKLKFFALVALSAALFAQPKMATISGVLQDPNGKPVTGTDGTVLHRKNTATQTEYTLALSTKGEFVLGGLPAGTYDLAIPMACCMYGAYQQTGIAVEAGQTLKLDIHMPWNINLGTIGDDPVMLMNDMRAKAKKKYRRTHAAHAGRSSETSPGCGRLSWNQGREGWGWDHSR